MTTPLPFALVKRLLAMDYTLRRKYLEHTIIEMGEMTLSLFLEYLVEHIEEIGSKAVWLDTIVSLLNSSSIPEDLKRNTYIRLSGGSRSKVFGFLSDAKWVPPEVSQETPYDWEDVPLGVRKARARKSEHLMLLATDPHPEVIRILLENPLATEDHAMRIASKRPQTPETFIVLLSSLRFGPRPSIQHAICLNPFCPPRVSMAILPLLSKKHLREVSESTFLDARVRESAMVLEKMKEV